MNFMFHGHLGSKVKENNYIQLAHTHRIHVWYNLPTFTIDLSHMDVTILGFYGICTIHVSSFYRTCKGKHTVYQWILWVTYAQYNNNSITRTNTKKSGFGVLDMVEGKTFWDQG